MPAEKRLQVTQTGKKIYLVPRKPACVEYQVSDTKTGLNYSSFNKFRAEGVARYLEHYYSERG